MKLVSAVVIVLLAFVGLLCADEPPEICTLAQADRIGRLVEMGPGGWVHLQVLSQHQDPRVRASVARGLRGVERHVGRPMLEKFLGDKDPIVCSAAVSSLLIGYRISGITLLKSILARDPASWRRLEASARYWSGIYTVQELNALLGPDVGSYPGMFTKIQPLGSWSTEPLLRIFSRPTTLGRMSQVQRLAGSALGDLGDPGAIPGLQKVLSQARRTGAKYQERAAAVSLYKLGQRSAALSLIRSLRAHTRSRWFDKEQKAMTLFQLAYLLHQVNEFEDAIQQYRLLIALGTGQNPTAYYNMACAYAMLKKKEHALHSLQQALRSGYVNKKRWIARDRELDFIRKDPRFIRMLENPKAELQFDLAQEKRR